MFIAGVLALAGVITFGKEVKINFYYSFGLCIFGSILGIAGGVLGLLGKDTDPIPYETQQWQLGGKMYCKSTH